MAIILPRSRFAFLNSTRILVVPNDGVTGQVDWSSIEPSERLLSDDFALVQVALNRAELQLFPLYVGAGFSSPFALADGDKSEFDSLDLPRALRAFTF